MVLIQQVKKGCESFAFANNNQYGFSNNSILFSSCYMVASYCAKKEHFLSWVGLRLPRIASMRKVLLISFLALILLLLPGIYLIVTFENKALLANAKFAGLGISGLIPILLYAVIQTGLCEEVFFRGFLNKRISNRFGFNIGNITQSVLFGLLHGVLLYGSVDMVFIIATAIFTMIVGWLMGYLNEKMSEGSIVLSWAVHSLMNIISSSVFWLGIVTVKA